MFYLGIFILAFVFTFFWWQTIRAIVLDKASISFIEVLTGAGFDRLVLSGLITTGFWLVLNVPS